MEKKIKVKPDTRQFVNQAWTRNGELEVTGQALVLACLLNSTGAGRNTDDMRDLQRLMGDINLDDKD